MQPQFDSPTCSGCSAKAHQAGERGFPEDRQVSASVTDRDLLCGELSEHWGQALYILSPLLVSPSICLMFGKYIKRRVFAAGAFLSEHWGRDSS
ncbi:hypothetical protein BD309DRAFT_417910 [Dichomitus squalens]|nr:hypothetical protein BD309DRAFT_417910 [Dichomitus squalens]